MTLLDQLRILKIPAWLKLMLAALLIALVTLNIYVIARGLMDQRYDFWIAAGASLLAAGAPILAVLSFLVITESGTGALKRRVQLLLALEIPQELRFVFEAPPPPLRAPAPPTSLEYRPNRARVECGIYRDELWANYRLTVRDGAGAGQIVRARVELTMSRANMNIMMRRKDAAAALGLAAGASLEEIGAAYSAAFKHTIAGATGAGYSFNTVPMCRVTSEGDDLAFVSSREIESAFVWDPATRLEFVQDLVLMLRSFVTERPSFFAAPAVS